MSLHHCFGDHVIGNCKAAPNPEVRLTGSQGVELARRYDLDVNPVVTMKVCQARHQPGGSEAVRRSEEHTSELQSLMRISYAVFCLKKKNKQIKIQMTLQT